jgi:hypothetical protein
MSAAANAEFQSEIPVVLTGHRDAQCDGRRIAGPAIF